MNLRTELKIPVSDFGINHSHKIMGFGSCFVDSIGEKLSSSKFKYFKNPFGVIFHPLAIENALARIHSLVYYNKNEIFNYKELYFSWDHHSSYNKTSLQSTLNNINKHLEDANKFIQEADVFILTFGTSWVYTLNNANLIVANCHKIPDKHFTKSLLSDLQLKSAYRNCFEIISDINPNAKIITTISPVRHTKDGIVENSLSKAKLISNLFEIIPNYENVVYFPAYEILMDDLRDYRFYAKDLVHPSEIAIDYIWEKFSDAYFSDATRELILQIEKINSALAHKPLNAGTIAHKKFLYSTYKKIEEIETQLIANSFAKEKESLKNQISNAN